MDSLSSRQNAPGCPYAVGLHYSSILSTSSGSNSNSRRSSDSSDSSANQLLLPTPAQLEVENLYTCSPYNNSLEGQDFPYKLIGNYKHNALNSLYIDEPTFGGVNIPAHWDQQKIDHCLSIAPYFANLINDPSFRLKTMSRASADELIAWIDAQERVNAKTGNEADEQLVKMPPAFWSNEGKNLSNFKHKIKSRYVVGTNSAGERVIELKASAAKAGAINVFREDFLAIVYEIHLNDEGKFCVKEGNKFRQAKSHLGKDRVMEILKYMDLDRLITRKMVEAVTFNCGRCNHKISGGAVPGAQRPKSTSNSPQGMAEETQALNELPNSFHQQEIDTSLQFQLPQLEAGQMYDNGMEMQAPPALFTAPQPWNQYTGHSNYSDYFMGYDSDNVDPYGIFNNDASLMSQPSFDAMSWQPSLPAPHNLPAVANDDVTMFGDFLTDKVIDNIIANCSNF